MKAIIRLIEDSERLLTDAVSEACMRIKEGPGIVIALAVLITTKATVSAALNMIRAGDVKHE